MSEEGRTGSLWDRYAPYFVREEEEVFPPDPMEEAFYRDVRAGFPGRCLELGAGSGRLTRCLAGSGCETVALEPSEAMLRLFGEALPGVHRVRGTGALLPHADGAFDLVVFGYNGIHCVLDPAEREGLLREACRVLAPGGCLLLETCPAFATRPSEPPTRRYESGSGRRRMVLVESVRRSPDGGTVIFDMSYYLGGSTEPDRITLELAAITAPELISEVRRAGLAVRSLWGDYDRSPWAGRLSPRLLLMACMEE